MGELNQFAVSKILGSKIKQVGPVGFGSFAAMSTAEEFQKAFRGDAPEVASPAYTYEQDAVVVRAFEDVRRGAPTDELLWNKDLARSFVNRCRELDLDAPHSYLVRRLVNVRKNSPRYKKKGIEIRPTTKKETHPSIVPEYAHVIEFALVRLRYRYGSSIDDILMDDCLCDKFEDLAHQIEPAVSSPDLRLGALYIRKNRVMKKDDLERLNALDAEALERALTSAVSLSKVRLDDVPVSPGLIELKEQDRYLYISHNKNIRSAVRQFGSGDAFRLMASSFWKPNLETIFLSFASGQRVAGVSIETWERKLVHDRNPVFNWPMPQGAA
jgi:hypothetical protein